MVSVAWATVRKQGVLVEKAGGVGPATSVVGVGAERVSVEDGAEGTVVVGERSGVVTAGEEIEVTDG